MATKVKICGITSLEDGLVAVDAGADAVGFIFYDRSPRFLSVEQAAAICARLPPFVVKVGVFVNAPEELVVAAAGQCGLSLLQFHGEEAPEYCIQFGLMSMKAFRVRGPEVLGQLEHYPTDAWLLDAWTPAQLGGTGETFNWDLATEAIKLGRPVFLAGGLTPENVAAAITRVRPYAVDVSSGVEAAPGRKDHAKVRAFIAAARKADADLEGQA